MSISLDSSNIFRFIKRISPALFVVIATLYIASVNQYWRPKWDSAFYIMLSKSILAGEGYSYLGYPSIKSPPGFPLLLCPIIGLWGNNFLIMNLFYRHRFARAFARIVFCIFLPYYFHYQPQVLCRTCQSLLQNFQGYTVLNL